MYKVKSYDREYQIDLSGNGQSGTINGESFELDVQKNNASTYHIIKDQKSYNIEIVKADYQEKTFELNINGNPYTIEAQDEFDLLLAQLGMSNLNDVKVNEVKAPMPGLVVDVLVNVGDSVAKNDPILILEAMKMENILKSPTEGIIKSINTMKGSAVEKNHVLISFE